MLSPLPAQSVLERSFGGGAKSRGRVMTPAPRCHWSGHVESLTPKGASIGWGLCEAPPLAAGELVRLTFRLPAGHRVNIGGRVQSSKSTAGKPEVQIAFTDMMVEDKTAITHFSTAHPEPLRVGEIGVEIVEKYSVECSAGLLRVRVCDVLHGEESLALAEEVREKIRASLKSQLLVFVDAVCLGPCPNESLGPFSTWFRALSGVCGVMVVKNAVARLQLKRVAREAGIADSVACFDDATDGLNFWNELCGDSHSGDSRRLIT